MLLSLWKGLNNSGFVIRRRVMGLHFMQSPIINIDRLAYKAEFLDDL